jgi:hypothetical protein
LTGHFLTGVSQKPEKHAQFLPFPTIKRSLSDHDGRIEPGGYSIRANHVTIGFKRELAICNGDILIVFLFGIHSQQEVAKSDRDRETRLLAFEWMSV